MENKIMKLLDSLEYSELLKLKSDVDSGSPLYNSAINKKLFEVETKHRKVCASCGSKISANIHDIFTLMFGEKTIRKKASFCGLDCLQDFLNKITVQKQELLKKEV